MYYTAKYFDKIIKCVITIENPNSHDKRLVMSHIV